MANDLTDDTTDMTRPASRTGAATGACWHCRNGHHALCTGVACLPLCTIDHPRHPGISGLSDGLEGGTSPKRGKR